MPRFFPELGFVVGTAAGVEEEGMAGMTVADEEGTTAGTVDSSEASSDVVGSRVWSGEVDGTAAATLAVSDPNFDVNRLRAVVVGVGGEVVGVGSPVAEASTEGVEATTEEGRLVEKLVGRDVKVTVTVGL